MAWAVTAGQSLTALNSATTPRTIAISGGAYDTGVINVQGLNSYAINVLAYCSTQGTSLAPLTTQIQLIWYADPQGTFEIYRESWWGWLGNGSGVAEPIVGRGPMSGPYMRVLVVNSSSATTFTLANFWLWGVATAMNASEWRQKVPGNLTSGITLNYTPVFDGSDGVLESLAAFPISAGVTVWQPMPLFTGSVWFSYQTTVVLANSFTVGAAFDLQNGGIIAGTSIQNLIWSPGNTANTMVEQIIIAPRSPMYYVIHSTATSPNVILTAFGSPP